MSDRWYGKRAKGESRGERFGLELESEEFDTLGGFVYHQLGRMPAPGDEVRADGLTMHVLSVLGRRIKKTVGSTVTEYLLDGNEEIAEYDGSGALLRRYVYGPAIDDRILMYEGTGTANADERFYYANGRIAVVPRAGGVAVSLTDAFDEDPSLVDWGPNGIWMAAARKTEAGLFRLDPDTRAAARVSARGLTRGLARDSARVSARGMASLSSCSPDTSCNPAERTSSDEPGWPPEEAIASRTSVNAATRRRAIMRARNSSRR